MSLNPHRYPSEEAYKAARFHFFRQAEGSIARVYGDSRAIPTWGIGYALLVSAQGQWIVRPSWRNDLAEANVLLDAATVAHLQAHLEEAAAALNNGDQDASFKIFPPWRAGEDITEANASGAPILTDTQVEALFDRVIDDYQKLLVDRLNRNGQKGAALVSGLAQSRELIALLSLTYNSPSLIGAGLSSALGKGYRPEAWFQIRHYSNGKKHPGLAKRRYHEAHLLGLYGHRSPGEARQVLEMYQKWAHIIDPYEQRLGSMVQKANQDYQLAGDPIATMSQVLADAHGLVG